MDAKERTHLRAPVRRRRRGRGMRSTTRTLASGRCARGTRMSRSDVAAGARRAGLSPVTMRTAACIAASRAAIPALLDALDAAERERDEARAETADLRATVDTMQVQLDAHRGGRDGAGHRRGGGAAARAGARRAPSRARGPSRRATSLLEVEYPAHRVRVFQRAQAGSQRARAGPHRRRWSRRSAHRSPAGVLRAGASIPRRTATCAACASRRTARRRTTPVCGRRDLRVLGGVRREALLLLAPSAAPSTGWATTARSAAASGPRTARSTQTWCGYSVGAGCAAAT